MATYAIGDVQGCFDELQALLKHIAFNPAEDVLWFTGDMVNRGPQSLAVLRFIKQLGSKHISILGNHDLHLLAVAYGMKPKHEGDTLDDVLSAPDRDEIIEWLRKRPLMHYDATQNFLMVHAGLAPDWNVEKAKKLAMEVENALRDEPAYFLKNMYGNEPDKWSDQLTGVDRLRCITNYFTRIRYCRANGQLDLAYKGKINDKPHDFFPWFTLPDRANANLKIIFGHWAALGGKTDVPNMFPIDTGCVWGNSLTALRLEDEKRFAIACAPHR